MTVLFAAGNENDGVSPGTAKNVITVGGHKNRYSGSPDEMYHWSSRGPTDDGRLKPDLVGPGMEFAHVFHKKPRTPLRLVK